MSSPCRASLALAAVALLGGCDREERDSRGQPVTETVPAGATADTIYPGGPSGSTVTLSPKAAAYENNAYHIAQGQQLYGQMNCVGCHAHGGGGMGPALIDDEWRYGGRIEQIATTIVEGRPNGMPSFRGKLTDTQIWELAAYVRAMSGQVRKDAVGARTDEPSNTPPLTQTRREPIVPGEDATP
ncbi:cytochrome c [Sphingomonas sp. BN140010]|uniref:Cytochrome c n=1 Tax=Sphingomonas arvum TaxID=2992113 RepID=A0ABT3JH82_9SPHN|nr:cytochrome c [Sphingomonas sp. BN140010]MCW3798437.1 cytochrome c [Sphingomonas sp. BN140010]